MCCAYWRTISRCPMSWLGALYCTPLTVKTAYLLTRAGISSYFVLGRAPRRQRPQHRAFDGLALGRAGIEALHDLLDERLVARAVVEAT
jgi:hypothetical protein